MIKLLFEGCVVCVLGQIYKPKILTQENSILTTDKH